MTMKNTPNIQTATPRPVRWRAWLASIFRRKPNEEQKPEPRWWEADWRRVREQFPVGKQFEYLGRKLVVSQYKWEMTMYVPPNPYMVCEYEDDRGKLHEWRFEVTMMPLLLANAPHELPPTKTL